MTSKRKKIKNDDIINHPEEWDFRALGTEDFHFAARYEYSRSAEWVLREFRKWHEQRVSLPKECDGYKEWHQRRIGEIIKLSHLEDVPFEILSAIWQSPPKALEQWPFTEAVWTQHFPQAYVTIPSQYFGDFDHIVSDWHRRRSAIEILPFFPKLSEDRKAQYAARGILVLPVWIDLKAGKKKLTEDAEKLLRLVQKQLQVKQPPTGKAAAVPLTPIKELAAYRFHKAGWNYKDTGNFLRNYEAQDKKTDIKHVLPIYASPGPWYRAITNATQRLQLLYPTPS